MKKILVVEGDLEKLNFMEKGLRRNPGLKVFTATTVEEAERIFNENLDLDIIAFDGNLKQGDINQKTVSLAEKIRVKFKRIIMIAMSCDPQIQEELMKVPCDYAVEKYKLAEFVRNLLSIV